MAKTKNPTGETPPVINLADMLARPVVNPIQQPPVFELDETQNIEDAETIEFDEVVEAAQAPAPEPAAEQAHVDEGFMLPRDMAEIFVNLIDGLQSSVLPPLIYKKTFSDKERELLQGLDLSGNTVYTDDKPKANVLQQWKDYQKKLHKVPFSPGESKRLINATERYVKTVDLKLTPLQGLMAAYSEVLINRGKLIFID